MKIKVAIIIIVGIILIALGILVWTDRGGEISIFGDKAGQIITKVNQSSQNWLRGVFTGTSYTESEGLKISNKPTDSTSSTVPINKIKTHHYQLQGAESSFESLKSLKVDALIIDIDDAGFTKDQINQLKDSGKTILSYLSIGEAEDYRNYWQTDWKVGNPEFLDEENSEWKGNYKVRYWEKEWQDIILAKVQKIAQQGYDGVYLDIIDAYEYYAEKGITLSSGKSPAEEMVNFVSAISAKGKGIDPKFLIVPQNSPELYLDYYNLYQPVIDGFGKEDTWYDENGKINQADQTKDLQALNKAIVDGKFVLAIDYPNRDNQNAICAFYKVCQEHQFSCTVTNRDLDQKEPVACKK